MHAGLVLTSVVLSGLATGLLTSGEPYDAAALAVAGASLALLIDRRSVRAVVLLAVAFCASAAEGAVARDRALASPLTRWFNTVATDDRLPEVVVVRGVLTGDAAQADSGVRLRIDVESIEMAGVQRRLPGRVQATVSGELAASRLDDWTAGRHVAAPVLLREPTSWRNPGSAGERWQGLHRPAELGGTIKSARLIEIAPGRWWDETGARVRQHVRRAARRFVAPRRPDAAAVIPATLIGDRAALPDQVQRRLQAAGTYHAIVISGAHIAILTSVCFVLFRVVVRSFRWVAFATMSVVVTYGWLVGGSPSVGRAVVAACIYLGVSLIGLRPRALNVLGATALVAAVADPLATLDAGAWLSFGATLGIVVGARRFAHWAARPPQGVPPINAPRPSWGRRCWTVVLDIFSATLAAELMVFPIAAALFSRVGLLGLVLNFIAIPAIAVVLFAGMTMSALAGWWDAGAAWSGWIAGVAAAWLIDSARAVDTAPWLVWRTPPTSLVWTVAYYAALVSAVSLRGRRRCRQISVLTAAVCLVAIAIAPGLEWARPTAGRLRLTVLDVGQGDALAVQFPSGHALLVDAGGVPGAFDVGERVVTPALWALGIRRLDWLAVTHGDLDHAGGMLAVARDLRPREIWEGVPVPPHAGLLTLRRQAQVDRVGWRQILAGHRLELGGVVVDVLHPPAPDWERRRVRNDDSLVLRIRFGEVEMLLTGDTGREFEEAFAASPGRGLLRLLKVAHHGSRSSSSLPFLRSFAPQMAFVSVGRGNPFGHPDPGVIARYQQLGTVVFRTDRDGAIVMETDGRVVDVTTISGRHWRARAQ